MANMYIPDRSIILPQELDSRLKTLSRLNQETSGVLLYETQNREAGLDLRVDTLYMTGRGQRLQVGIDPQRKAIIDDFLTHHPEYKYIEWHAHITGSKGLSEDDRRHYSEELASDPYFIAMIITKSGRTTIKSKNSGQLHTDVVQTPNEFYAREGYLQKELENSTRRLGLDNLPILRATRSRR